MSKCCKLKLTESQKIMILDGVARQLRSMGLLSAKTTSKASRLTNVATALVQDCKSAINPDTFAGDDRRFDVQDAVTIAKAVCAVADVVCPFVEEM